MPPKKSAGDDFNSRDMINKIAEAEADFLGPSATATP
jgi:hypothetical protein